jgi:predicted nucleic acid-binding protein
MTDPVFVDTNVFVYAADAGDPEKQRKASLWLSELWKSRIGRISFQVLQEFFVTVTHKKPDAREQARAQVRDLLVWRPSSRTPPSWSGHGESRTATSFLSGMP